MTTETRRLYRSANGDRWHLVRETDSGRVFIKHEANDPSGGQVTEIEIGDFLSSGGHGPAHRAVAPHRNIGGGPLRALKGKTQVQARRRLRFLETPAN